MKTDHEMETIERVAKNAVNNRLCDASKAFLGESVAAKYSYNFSWLGRPIIQYPQDMIALQEIVWKVQPDLIIETGIAHGGSLIFSASLLELLDLCDVSATRGAANTPAVERRVLGIDIDLREHNRLALDEHPLRHRIITLDGSSTSPDIIREAVDIASTHKHILVCLDSNHEHEHVLKELNAYAPLVSQGSYCVVFDTLIEDLPESSFPDRPWGKGDNPKTAVRDFLKKHTNFKIDTSMDNKLMISAAPTGYLKRVC